LMGACYNAQCHNAPRRDTFTNAWGACDNPQYQNARGLFESVILGVMTSTPF